MGLGFRGIWGMWRSYRYIPKTIFYLLEGDYNSETPEAKPYKHRKPHKPFVSKLVNVADPELFSKYKASSACIRK